MSKKKVKKSNTEQPKIIGNTQAITGKVDKKKILQSKKIKKAAIGGAGFGWNTFSGSGMNASYMNNSYANMGQATTAFGDVPLYLALLNEQNGGVLYWPVSLKQKYSFFRYFNRSDPFVRSAVRLHTDLPMSKLVLRMPKMKNKTFRKKILYKYQNMVKNLNLFDKLRSVLFQNCIIGNVFTFCEYDEQKKEWSKIVILPPQQVTVSRLPMSNESKIQYCPEVLGSLLKRYAIPVQTQQMYQDWIFQLDEQQKQVMENIPYDLTKQLVQNNGVLVMDTSPYCGDNGHQVGSFVYHFSQNKHEYDDLGVSPLQCVLIPLLMKEHYKYTQLNLASRNMTPRNKITAPQVPQQELQALRQQIDLSMLSPDYSIVTNYDWTWEQIGASDRLIDLGRQYDNINEQLFAGLGVTKELLTGQGMYSGSKISVQILNTRYMLSRQMLQRFVEENLFLPMAKQNDFYEQDQFGNKIWLYPRLSFSRLTIRDNAQVFDSLFQLYQKGSLPISYLYQVFNLDEDEINQKLKQDMFTVKDATFNDLIRGVYSDITSKISQQTDLADQIIKTMVGPQGKPLKKVAPQQQGGDEEGYSDNDSEQTQLQSPLQGLEQNSQETQNVQQQPLENEALPMSVDELLQNIDEKQQLDLLDEFQQKKDTLPMSVDEILEGINEKDE